MVGDAAHAIVPFFGQGMNASFEDVFVLNAELEKAVSYKKGDNLGNAAVPWAEIFDTYQKLRKRNADAIADLAETNYFEMRDKVADKEYQLLKKIQDRLGASFPGQFVSRYEMVSFSNMPYVVAQEQGQIGENIARELAKNCNGDASQIDMKLAEELVNKHYPKGWAERASTVSTRL